MSLAQSALHAIGSVQAAVLLFAIVSVIFWRVLLRIILMVVAIVLIALLLSGMIMLLQGIHLA